MELGVRSTLSPQGVTLVQGLESFETPGRRQRGRSIVSF